MKSSEISYARESHSRAERVSKLNFSFSPGFSLGFSVRLKLGNRFNGFQVCATNKPQAEAWGE
jgi:hypothetical protein